MKRNTKENIVFIKWLAENEMNTEKFVIQRSSDGNTFKNLGELPPSGPINILTEYNSSDDITGISSGVAYYRIKAEDSRVILHTPMWFRFVYPNQGALVSGQTHSALH